MESYYNNGTASTDDLCSVPLIPVIEDAGTTIHLQNHWLAKHDFKDIHQFGTNKTISEAVNTELFYSMSNVY
jgi:hypothetical protein